MPKPKDDLTKRIGTKNAARIKAIVKRAKAEGKSPRRSRLPFMRHVRNSASATRRLLQTAT